MTDPAAMGWLDRIVNVHWPKPQPSSVNVTFHYALVGHNQAARLSDGTIIFSCTTTSTPPGFYSAGYSMDFNAVYIDTLVGDGVTVIDRPNLNCSFSWADWTTNWGGVQPLTAYKVGDPGLVQTFYPGGVIQGLSGNPICFWLGGTSGELAALYTGANSVMSFVVDASSTSLTIGKNTYSPSEMSLYLGSQIDSWPKAPGTGVVTTAFAFNVSVVYKPKKP